MKSELIDIDERRTKNMRQKIYELLISIFLISMLATSAGAIGNGFISAIDWDVDGGGMFPYKVNVTVGDKIRWITEQTDRNNSINVTDENNELVYSSGLYAGEKNYTFWNKGKYTVCLTYLYWGDGKYWATQCRQEVNVGHIYDSYMGDLNEGYPTLNETTLFRDPVLYMTNEDTINWIWPENLYSDFWWEPFISIDMRLFDNKFLKTSLNMTKINYTVEQFWQTREDEYPKLVQTYDPQTVYIYTGGTKSKDRMVIIRWSNNITNNQNLSIKKIGKGGIKFNLATNYNIDKYSIEIDGKNGGNVGNEEYIKLKDKKNLIGIVNFVRTGEYNVTMRVYNNTIPFYKQDRGKSKTWSVKIT